MSCKDVQQVGFYQLIGTCFDWVICTPPHQIGAPALSSIFTDRNGNEWQLKLSCTSSDSKFPKACLLAIIPVKFGESVRVVSGLLNLTICPLKNCFSDCYRFSELLVCEAEQFSLYINEEHTLSVYIAAEGGVKVHCRIFVKPAEGKLRKTPLETFCKTLLDEAVFSDATISTQGSSFKAHKAMLSVRSPVMKAMFLSNFTESKENVLDLSAFSEPVVKEFLEFIYTDRAEIHVEDADEWLRISDMYQMDDLKEYVEYRVGQAITMNNALIIFQTAYTYEAQLLKRTVSKFLKNNGKSVAANKGPIEELAKVNPELIPELFKAIAG